MYLVNNAAICFAFLGNIECEITNQGQDAGQNFPTNGRSFLTDGRLSSASHDGRLWKTAEYYDTLDVYANISVSLPDGRNQRVDYDAELKRSVSLPDGRLSGVERSVSLPDRRLSGVERSAPLPDGRLSAVERRVATVDRIKLAGNDRRVSKNTYFAQGIVNGSRPFGDSRTSAIGRVISNHRVCTIDIVAKFPDLKNKGSAVAALLMMGKYGQGETGVGNMINFWDGGAGINIPFYGSQSLNKLYLEARLQPTAGTQLKQVFATSCYYVDRVPTFEVNFDQFQGTGGVLTILARTDGIPGLAEISFPYNFNDEFILRVIYDGQRIGAFLDNTVPNMSNSGARSLSGFISIDRSGLRFAHCRNRDKMSGFIGHVSEIKFTKCLTTEMQEALNSIPAVV